MSGHVDMICSRSSAETLTWAQTWRTRGLMASLHSCASGCRSPTRLRRKAPLLPFNGRRVSPFLRSMSRANSNSYGESSGKSKGWLAIR
eukprot:13603253-Heterocapsa_arctica.AAC.1